MSIVARSQFLRFVLVIISMGLCVSCGSIIYSYPPSGLPKGPHIPGEIGYAVHGASTRKFDRDHQFVQAVERALKDSGYPNPILLSENELTTHKEVHQLTLIVNVDVLGFRYDYGHYAAPQEWLTGLSLGLIPSWATRHEIKILFQLFDGETLVKRWEYMTASLWINHLLLFPINIFQTNTPDETRQSAQLATATEYFMRSDPTTLDED